MMIYSGTGRAVDGTRSEVIKIAGLQVDASWVPRLERCEKAR